MKDQNVNILTRVLAILFPRYVHILKNHIFLTDFIFKRYLSTKVMKFEEIDLIDSDGRRRRKERR